MAVVVLRSPNSICRAIISAAWAICISSFSQVSTIATRCVNRKRTSIVTSLAARGGPDSSLLTFVSVDLAWIGSVVNQT